jgi:hypothetical protein
MNLGTSWLRARGPKGCAHAARALATDWLPLALMLAVYAHAWRSLEAFVSAVDHCDRLFCDFVRHFYPMGQAIRLAEPLRPVGRFFYPPFAALSFGPIAMLPVNWATWCWGLIEVAAVLCLVLIPNYTLFRERPGLRFLHSTLVASSLPVLHCIKWGQVSLPLTALTMLAIVLRQSGRLALPSFLLSFAMSIKLYPGIILVSYLARRDWKFIFCCAGWTAFLSLGVPSLLLGPQNAWSFFLIMQREAAYELHTWVRFDVNSQFSVHVLGRWIGRPIQSSTPAILLGASVVLANAGLLWAARQIEVKRPLLWAWALCFGCLPFLLQTSWAHYFVYLPVIQAGLALELSERMTHKSFGDPWAWVKLGLWTASVTASSSFVLLIVGSWESVARHGVFFLSNLAALVLCWLILLPEVAHRQS